MRISHFLILVWLTMRGSAFMEAQAQPRLYNCSRPTIEAYPEEEKRPVLQFPDNEITHIATGLNAPVQFKIGI